MHRMEVVKATFVKGAILVKVSTSGVVRQRCFYSLMESWKNPEWSRRSTEETHEHAMDLPKRCLRFLKGDEECLEKRMAIFSG